MQRRDLKLTALLLYYCTARWNIWFTTEWNISWNILTSLVAVTFNRERYSAIVTLKCIASFLQHEDKLRQRILIALIGYNLLTLFYCTLARNKLLASGSVFRFKMNYDGGGYITELWNDPHFDLMERHELLYEIHAFRTPGSQEMKSTFLQISSEE